MHRFIHRRRALWSLAVVAGSACVMLAYARATVTQIAVIESAPLTALPVGYDAANARDLDVDFFSMRIADDPSSAADRSSLAALLFARSKATGSGVDLARAESLAREAVKLRTAHNGAAFELLASILMTRHAFQEARVIMQQADSLSPDTPSHLALLGEIELELGEYDAASAHFSAVHFDGQQFTIGARVARWYELTGHADIARRLLLRSANRADRRDDLPRDQVAWFHYRLGDLALRVGNLRAADSAFNTALTVNPHDVRALGGLARLALYRKQWSEAIHYGEEATAVQLDPATVGVMSAAYAAQGDSEQAATYAQAMATSAGLSAGGMHRAYGLFLLDHGSKAERARVLRRAQADLVARHDVYGYDLLAWALYRAGRLDDSQRAMTQALSQHTEDLILAEHARAIFAAGQIASVTPPLANTKRE